MIDWTDHAACRNHDPEIWFPPVLESGGAARTHPQVTRAVEICRQCPVIAECLEWAQETRVRHGIWGGLIPADRVRGADHQPAADHRGAAPWTADDDETLLALAAIRQPHQEIAARLGRTRSAVGSRLELLRKRQEANA